MLPNESARVQTTGGNDTPKSFPWGKNEWYYSPQMCFHGTDTPKCFLEGSNEGLIDIRKPMQVCFHGTDTQ